MYIFARKTYFIVYVIENTLRINFILFPFGQISIKYENIEIDVYVMFRVKYG
jgi:hypothetical protein